MYDEFSQQLANTIHGNYSGAGNTAFARYNTDIFGEFPFYPMHWHEDMEIIKITSGHARFFVDGQCFSAQEGDFVVMRPFAMHSVVSEGSCLAVDAVVFNVRLTANNGNDRALKYFAPLLNDKNAFACIVSQKDDCYTAFDECVSTLTALPTVTEKDAHECLSKLFLQVYSNRLVQTSQNLTEDKRCYTVQRMLEYVYERFSQEISIKQIAEHCGYSEFYTMKLFKQFTGYSLVDYLNNYRLTLVGRRIRRGEVGFAEMARETGFNNISYFNRQFKKLYGCTPKQFKKQ